MSRARELADLLTGGQTITTADNTEQLIFKSTDADASAGPLIKMHRDSSSPADGDNLGRFNFIGENDASEEVTYARIHAKAGDVTDGTEDGQLLLLTTVAGTNRSRMAIGPSETVFNEDSIDSDFRVESDNNANALFVQGSSGNIGISTTSPVANLEVEDGGTSNSILTKITADDQNPFALMIGNDTFSTTDSNALGFLQRNNGDGYIYNTGSVRATIDSSGNIGIGTSSPAVALHVQAGSGQIRLHEGNAADNKYGQIEVSNGKLILHSDKSNVESNSTMQFHLDNSEKMRIDHLGRVFFFCTDEPSSSVDGAAFVNNEGELRFGNSTTGNTTRVRFYNPNGEVGAIRTNGSNTSYITSSDYRLKENVVDMSGAIDRVKALAPKRFNFIADADTTVDGFLAHEAQTVVPEAISGTKDAVDEDGNMVVQGIDQSKLVPLLTGALQEAIAKIESLETKVAALEAGE